MLADAPDNKGKPKTQWTPPPGYKSALGKARDAAKAQEAKKKSPVAAPTVAEDTASEDDGEYSQVGTSFRICALRQPVKKSATHHNKSEELDEPPQEYDDEMLQDLNNFAHKVSVNREKTKMRSQPLKKLKKMKTASSTFNDDDYPALNSKSLAPGIGCNIEVNHEVVKDDSVVIKCAKDLDKIDRAIINPLPYDNKALAKMSKKIEGLVDKECGEDEFLALLDTGSSTHAIDAARHLPANQILAVPKSEQH